MIALSFSQINKVYYEQVVLDGVSFSINTQDKLGLIGKNGAGKTTLLRLIAGIEQADSGNIFMDGKLKVGYMKQSDDVDEDATLISFCMEAFKDLLALEDKLHVMEKRMGAFTDHSEDFDRFMAQYDALSHHFEKEGGYVFKSKVRGILNGLGFSEEAHDRSVSTLSGGQLARLKLARLLIDEPDILILDEPTNHLDIATTAWLEAYLKQYPKTMILVSHDRYFLDNVCNKIMEIELAKVMLFDGNYTAFKRKKAARLEELKRTYDKAVAERAKQEALIRKFKQHGTEKLAKRARSREKRLGHMDLPTAVHLDQSKMRLNLKSSHSSGTEVLHVENLTKTYDQAPVLTDVSFNVFKGEKIGLIGKNGSGKSTLLKVLEGELDYDSGKITYGHNVLTAYYDQSHENLDEASTIIEEIHNFVPQMNEEDIRTLLGRFLFTTDEVFKPISVLSGGEKARVMLTKLFLTDTNFLLMDEPTNHLDLYSKEVLEDTLRDYDGTLLVISHDRYFLDSICESILEIEDQGLTLYHGGYTYYVEKKAALNAKPQEEQGPLNKTEKKADRKKEKQQQSERKALQKRMTDIESEISAIEDRLEAIAHDLCDEAIYSNQEKTKAILSQEKSLKENLDALFEEWETLSLSLED